MMEQYLASRLSTKMLFILSFRGFHELLMDAVKAAQILELTLTSRNKNAEEPILCGGALPRCQQYTDTLIEQGYKVAICEQVEDQNHQRNGQTRSRSTDHAGNGDGQQRPIRQRKQLFDSCFAARSVFGFAMSI